MAQQGRRIPGIAALIFFLISGGFYLQSTLASNISINPTGPVQFGQGITQIVSCAGISDTVTVTPNSKFTNASGSGAFYFNSVTVSNIPTACSGADFTIAAYGNTDSSPLAIFNTSSTNAVVWNNAGVFYQGAGSANSTVSTGSKTFTVTFNTPVATSASVYKIALTSSPHTSSCLTGETCALGETGPGGGTVFYSSIANGNPGGFNCGFSSPTAAGLPTTPTCHYLEFAPSNWTVGGDPLLPWALPAYQSSGYSDITNNINNSNTANLGTAAEIGAGLWATRIITSQNEPCGYSCTTFQNTYAAGAARAYNGNSKTDWYLPVLNELRQLCRYAAGQAWASDTTTCTTAPIRGGFVASNYYMADTYNTPEAWDLVFVFGSTPSIGSTARSAKGTSQYVRPIRAF